MFVAFFTIAHDFPGPKPSVETEHCTLWSVVWLLSVFTATSKLVLELNTVWVHEYKHLLTSSAFEPCSWRFFCSSSTWLCSSIKRWFINLDNKYNVSPQCCYFQQISDQTANCNCCRSNIRRRFLADKSFTEIQQRQEQLCGEVKARITHIPAHKWKCGSILIWTDQKEEQYYCLLFSDSISVRHWVQ